jgi:hypothetical protein
VRLHELPLTPERVWRALRARRRNDESPPTPAPPREGEGMSQAG